MDKRKPPPKSAALGARSQILVAQKTQSKPLRNGFVVSSNLGSNVGVLEEAELKLGPLKRWWRAGAEAGF